MHGDEEVIEFLNEALTAELTAINQYFIHAKMCDNWGYQRLSAKKREESIEEMRHADETIERHGIKTVLTHCAHCFNTFRNEYPGLGARFEVVHHAGPRRHVADGGAVVDRGLAFPRLVPRLDGLDAELELEGRGYPVAGLEQAAHRILTVGVAVDESRGHDLALGFEGLFPGQRFFGDGGDPTSLDSDVADCVEGASEVRSRAGRGRLRADAPARALLGL